MDSEIGIILVSYGTASKDSKERTTDFLEKKMREQFPDCWIESAFTSRYMIDKAKERDQISVSSFEEALQNAAAEGVKKLIVQQVHLVNGYTWDQEVYEIEKYKDFFEKIEVGKHLLADDQDVHLVSSMIMDEADQFIDGETVVCFIGHGTESNLNVDYMKLQTEMEVLGNQNCLIGVLHGKPSIDEILFDVKMKKCHRVVLIPLMLTAGYHVKKNVLGTDENSWKSRFEAEGFEVEYVMRGLGEKEEIIDIFLAHTQNAMENLLKR